MLSKQERDELHLDDIDVDVSMGLSCWNFILQHLPESDTTTHFIRGRCQKRLVDLLPDIFEGDTADSI